MDEIGAFCSAYGNSARNRIIEHLLEDDGLDFAIGDVAKQTKLSRPKAYEVILRLEKDGVVQKSRVVGRTQLYRLNGQSQLVILFRSNFLECLRIVASENSSRSGSGHQRIGTVSAKEK
jgi:DNA-binding transcriptional ArsR family regulator